MTRQPPKSPIPPIQPIPDPATAPVSDPQPSAWNIANALTILRLLMVPLYAWLLLNQGGHTTSFRWWAAVVFALAMVTDRIDGDLARSRGLVTNFGKVADPIADKALVSTSLIGLSIIGEIPWWITVLIIGREWGVTALRFFVIRHGVMAASRGGKIKTVLQGLALFGFTMPLASLPAASLWHVVAWVVLAAAAIITVVTGIDYVGRAIRLRAGSERTARKRAARQRADRAVADRQQADGQRPERPRDRPSGP